MIPKKAQIVNRLPVVPKRVFVPPPKTVSAAVVQRAQQPASQLASTGADPLAAAVAGAMLVALGWGMFKAGSGTWHKRGH